MRRQTGNKELNESLHAEQGSTLFYPFCFYVSDSEKASSQVYKSQGMKLQEEEDHDHDLENLNDVKTMLTFGSSLLEKSSSYGVRGLQHSARKLYQLVPSPSFQSASACLPLSMHAQLGIDRHLRTAFNTTGRDQNKQRQCSTQRTTTSKD